MVLPFPNEIWLDIFHGLAKEGEYDALERCRVVCREFRPVAEECLLGSMSFKSTEDVERIKLQVPGGEMRRWRGPQTVGINGGNWNDGHRPIPHLETFASRFGGRWPAVEMLWISNAMWQAADLDADAVFHDLARFPITELFLYDIIFPTILTLGRLVCALPRLKYLTLTNVQFTRQPFDPSTISQFRLLPRTQLETLSLGGTFNTPEPSPPFVELVSFMACVSTRTCLVPLCNPPQAYLWSAVRTLNLLGAIFPSVTTFARLLCALPALENLVFRGPWTFSKHGFNIQSIHVHPNLPLGLVAIEFQSNSHSDPLSMDDLVDFFITTGTSSRLRDIKLCPSRSLQATTESDVSLTRLVRHTGQSLHELSLSLWERSPLLNGEPVSPYSDPTSAPYFDVSENTCLEHLDFTISFRSENGPCLCTPIIDVLSRVASPHISKISVQFHHAEFHDVKYGMLIEKLPQLDAILSRPVFDNLAHVNVDIHTTDGVDVQDEKRANDLRVCLAKLDARGILGILVNFTRMGLRWDFKTGSWKRYGVERGAAQDGICKWHSQLVEIPDLCRSW